MQASALVRGGLHPPKLTPPRRRSRPPAGPRSCRAVQLDDSLTSSSAESSLMESTVDEDGGAGLAERLVAAGIAPVRAAELFDEHFTDVRSWTPLLAVYFPFGCTLALLRMALWIGGIALDLPAWRSPSVVAGFLALLGVTVDWRGEARVPAGRHVLVSNHVSNGDLLMLFNRARRYTHLITPLLPAPVFATRNLPAILAPANKGTYEALAGAAAAAAAAGGNDAPSAHDAAARGADGAPSSSGRAGSGGGGGGGGGTAAGRGLHPEALEAPVHLFPEGGMTNGRGMMAFSRGFTRFAADGEVVPIALRLKVRFPQVRAHTLTSGFLTNLFFFSWQPWTRLEATVLQPMRMEPGEGRGAFVQRVQFEIARELGSYVVPGFSVHHKRAMAGGGGARRRPAGAE
ncbi:hypothetical protein Rsub_02396 [Raphidocelis subcapitata]|uniref:Phospholipid/glycerol acyltransferase domain-containing protein n=1 Tax=Raphidocelis subcapitata TaxID=307507 RepID=A0A2V0NXH7_9CHLO|nr:hypothetical protein Rsub_02396 [Raphidocelis subcapitata]|eukprot:GBF90290.1 hypothetical protein Rsub_02396 [Raphidocelis subcapitata]